MGESVAILMFWTSALLAGYGYIGYPLVIYLLGHLQRRPTVRKEIVPRVSLLVPAYNEADTIRAKIENCLQLDYPKDRLEILVASDGSTDGTAELIQEAADAGMISGLVCRERRGKAAVINDLVRMASGEVVVFSDAASMLEPGSLRALAGNFADPHVGCVSGVYRVVKGRWDAEAEQENLYWRYETFIRLSESRLGTMLGAHGSMYAIRRELFEPLDRRMINDDFVIPMSILMKGYCSIYDTRAIAREDAAEMAGFSRRIRIMAGNYQQMGLLLRKGVWRRPLVLFQLLSHKGLRLMMPLCLVSMYVGNAYLLAQPAYRMTFAAQSLFFLAAALGLSSRARRFGRAFIAAPYHFCMLNVAAVVGLYRTVWKKDAVLWKAR